MIKNFFNFYFIPKVLWGYNFMSAVEIQKYLWNDIQMHASSPLPHYYGSGLSNELQTNFICQATKAATMFVIR